MQGGGGDRGLLAWIPKEPQPRHLSRRHHDMHSKRGARAGLGPLRGVPTPHGDRRSRCLPVLLFRSVEDLESLSLLRRYGRRTWIRRRRVHPVERIASVVPPVSGTTITQPSQPWSPNTLTVDCAGHFKLCYTLKAGKADNPQPTDCELISVCTEADYPTENVEQAFPDLPSWLAVSPAQKQCSMQFASSGGYGEMSVVGLSVECDEIDDGSGGPKVFNRVQYCPLSCATNPNGPGCENCQAGGSGSF